MDSDSFSESLLKGAEELDAREDHRVASLAVDSLLLYSKHSGWLCSRLAGCVEAIWHVEDLQVVEHIQLDEAPPIPGHPWRIHDFMWSPPPDLTTSEGRFIKSRITSNDDEYRHLN
jgi:hypothetical protein